MQLYVMNHYFQVRELNLYGKDDKTPFDQPVDSPNVRYCWNEVKEKSGYEQRKEAIETFNRYVFQPSTGVPG